VRLEDLQDIAFALEGIPEVLGVFEVISPRADAPSIYVQIAHEARSLTVTRAHYAIRRQTGRFETAGIVFVEELPPRLGVRPVLLNETARIAARGRASARAERVETENALFPVGPQRTLEALVVDAGELARMVSELYEPPHRVTRVRTVADALAALRASTPHEVVVSEALGVGEGKLLLAIRDSYAYRNLRVLLVVPEENLPTALRSIGGDRPWQVVSVRQAKRAVLERFRRVHLGRPAPVRVLLVDRDPETASLTGSFGADVLVFRVEHTDDALWLLREAPFALVLCDATLTEGTTFAYRTLWEQEPSTKSKTFLVAPRASVDALPPSRDPARHQRVLARPVTREAVMALLAEIANGQYDA